MYYILNTYFKYRYYTGPPAKADNNNTLAASPYCPLVKSMLNFLTKRSSAPAKLFLTAKRRAKSGFCSTVLMYGTIESSSTVTDKT